VICNPAPLPANGLCASRAIPLRVSMRKFFCAGRQIKESLHGAFGKVGADELFS
jgi:hypothetical protein